MVLLFLWIYASMHEILSDVAVEDVNGWLLIAVGCFSAQSGTAADLTLRCG
jgi:hypothetical protein